MAITEEFERVYGTYNELRNAGKDVEADVYLKDEFLKLPEEARERLMLEMLTIAMKDAADERDAITKMQEEGVAAIHVLDLLRAEAEDEARNEKKS